MLLADHRNAEAAAAFKTTLGTFPHRRLAAAGLEAAMRASAAGTP
jgi:hypothetical protein